MLGGRATDHEAKILIMEDDPALVRLLSLNLEGEGYTVHFADDGVEGLRLAFDEKPDLVILDIMMPVMDGWGVCQRLREVSDVPILMLTCRSDLRDKVRGLSMGADDYLPKPFDMEELFLRIEALLRRSRWRPYVARPTTFDDGNLLVNLEAREVRRGKKRVELTPTEFRLLACFIRNPGRLLSKEYILSQVWGPEYVEALHYVKVYVRHLRRKIEANPPRPRYILTERGVGYWFAPQAASGERSEIRDRWTKRILLVGSDLTLLKRLEEVLRERAYRVGKAYSLDQALGRLFHYSPQLVILQGDTTSSSLNLLNACRRIREVSRVLTITLSSNKVERLGSLELGADDSLPRPLDMEELLARVAVLLRRTDRETLEPRLSIYSAPGIWINFDTHEVSIGDKVVRLTPGEFRLLEYLVRHAGQILTHEQLLEAISVNLSRPNKGIIRQYISRLRRKIEADPALPSLIITHRGLGYSFSLQGEREAGS